MASNSDSVTPADKEIRSQLDELRSQIASLLEDKVAPRVAAAKQEAEAAVHQVRDAAGCGAATVAKEIRDRPFTSVAIAAALGLLIGRLTR